MHKLTRPQQEPQALTTARTSQYPDWNHFPQNEKNQVRDELLRMQNFRCAYCERAINENHEVEDGYNGHIEHFRRKNVNFYPERVFDWENLYYSCLTSLTCGKYKDKYIKTKEQYDLLIDPCLENPEDFFVFDDRGRIAVRNGLKGSEIKRAEFTIKAFHLNEPRLIKLRKDVQKQYCSWIKQYPREQILKYLHNDDILNAPFITAIYHYFGERVISQ